MQPMSAEMSCVFLLLVCMSLRALSRRLPSPPGVLQLGAIAGKIPLVYLDDCKHACHLVVFKHEKVSDTVTTLCVSLCCVIFAERECWHAL